MQFLVDKLRSQCLDYVETKITRDTSLQLLKQAVEFNMDDVQDKCLRVIAKNFHFLVSGDFSFVPVPIMVKLCMYLLSYLSVAIKTYLFPVQHPQLAVKNEYTVYTIACKYIEDRNVDTMSEADVTAIFEAVRFPFLTIKQVEKAQQNPMVPRHLIIEGKRQQRQKK